MVKDARRIWRLLAPERRRYLIGLGALALVNSDGEVIWSRHGAQSTEWLFADAVPLYSEAFTFLAFRGASYQSDIAIDDVSLVCTIAPPRPPSPTPPPYLPSLPPPQASPPAPPSQDAPTRREAVPAATHETGLRAARWQRWQRCNSRPTLHTGGSSGNA